MLKNRQILVTGSSSGIGLSICTELLKKGAKVLGISRHESKSLKRYKNYVGYSLDLSDTINIVKKFKKILCDHPNIDGLVSNAGYGAFGKLEQFSSEQVINFVNVNLIAHMLISSELIRHFKTNKRGDIIFMGSEAALSGSKSGSLYCATKFGLRGFSQALKAEGANKNVRICLINPGAVRTPFFDELSFQPADSSENAIEPRTVADIIIQVLSTKENTVIDEINLSPIKKSLTFQKNKN